MITIICQ